MGHVQFKIKPYKGKHFFLVRIFDTEKEMYTYYLDYAKEREAAAKLNPKVNSNRGYSRKLNWAGIVMPFSITRKDAKEKTIVAPNIGEVLMWQKRLGAGIVAHEMGHCALWYDRLINNNKNASYGKENNKNEERLLYILADLVRGFTNTCYKLKIYK